MRPRVVGAAICDRPESLPVHVSLILYDLKQDVRRLIGCSRKTHLRAAAWDHSFFVLWGEAVATERQAAAWPFRAASI
jgi:hypothetical protein